MPRIRPLINESKESIEYDLKILSERVISDVAIKGIKKQDLAKRSGVQPSAISNQFKKKRITIETFLAWQKLTKEMGYET